MRARSSFIVLFLVVMFACWWWIVIMARDMYGPMTGASAWMMTPVWDAPHLLLLWAMWAVMMTAMMLPSAAPMILLAGGVGIGWRSLVKVAEIHAPPAVFVIWPLVASAVIKSVLSGLKFHFGNKIQSAALVADAWNDGIDILSALVALIAVVLSIYDPSRFLAADHYGGFAVGVIVIFTGLRVARDTALQLMDTMPDENLMNRIREVALGVPGVRGVEKCYARKTGLTYHVDLHLELDPDLTVRESHHIATEVRVHLKESLEWVADVLVHVEPAP
jgi:cation diffusion facilitator family transporter